MSSQKRFRFDAGVILCVSSLLALMIYFWGIPGGSDMAQHYQFAQTFYDSLTKGIIYPSWSAETNFGYGDVGVRFYPPLTYYVLSFFRLIAGNWYEASSLMIAFFFFFSGLGAYLWSREYVGENSSLLGAVFYLILPYHLFQVFQDSLLAEFAAAAIIPFCFLYVTRICQKKQFSDVYRLGLAFGLLILTHIPTTVMASIALTVYVLFSLRKTDFIQTELKLSAGVLIGLLLSSFYWVRMITELDWVKHNSEVFSSGNFGYQMNFAFPFLARIFGVELNYSKSLLNQMVLVTLAILLSNIVLHFLNVKKEKARLRVNVLAMTAFSLFMVLPLSILVWENVPLLQKIQFPWRWLIFVSLGSAIFVALSFETLLAYLETPQRYLSVLTLGLLLLCIAFNALRTLNHQNYIPKDFFSGLIERGKTGKSNDCWWTTWMPSIISETDKTPVSRLEFIPQRVVINNRQVEIKTWNATERIFTIFEGEAGQATAATMYYPHWKVEIDGEESAVSPSQNGLISFPVSAEKSEVRLFFQEPPHVITAFYLSGFAWLLILGLLIKTHRQND